MHDSTKGVLCANVVDNVPMSMLWIMHSSLAVNILIEEVNLFMHHLTLWPNQPTLKHMVLLSLKQLQGKMHYSTY